MDVMAVLRITMGGWMVNEMNGCNNRFKNCCGWMVKEMDGCNGRLRIAVDGW